MTFNRFAGLGTLHALRTLVFRSRPAWLRRFQGRERDVRDESASVCLGGAGRQCIEAVRNVACRGAPRRRRGPRPPARGRFRIGPPFCEDASAQSARRPDEGFFWISLATLSAEQRSATGNGPGRATAAKVCRLSSKRSSVTR